MTKKDFTYAMRRGLGRCVTAVRRDPEKYRDIVLRACKKNIAYDAQVEGTRCWYVYTMVNAYPDPETFITAAVDALKKYRPRNDWDLLHLSELLMFFAMDGYHTAKTALDEKYAEVLEAMFARKNRPDGVFHELADLEQLGLVLAVDPKSFCRIAADFGRLYQEKSYMLGGEFAWFFSSKGDQYKKTMERAAQKNESIAFFMQRERADISVKKEKWTDARENYPADLTGIRLSRWLERKADRDTIEQYARAYREQTQPELRAKALTAFAICPYPGDPGVVLEDIRSDCEVLRNAAWRALENIRDPAVRTFALENVCNGIHTPENFALLVTNCVPEDGALLESLLREQIAAKNWDGIHAAGMDIKRAFYKDSGIPHPKHLLPLLYEYTPCSFCRESAIRDMARHRMLTAEILNECLYDSSYDIRSYAAKRLRK